MDLSHYCSFDTETLKFRPGYHAPRIVCASTARATVVGDSVRLQGELVVGWRAALEVFRTLLRGGYKILCANAAYDLAVAAQHDSALLAEIFRAIEEERVHDVLIAQALDAIYGGHLGQDPRTGQELRNPETGKVTTSYSLASCVDLVLDRTNAKDNDVWRQSYGLLEGFPVEVWPFEARQYPVDDAENTLEVALGQIFERPGLHAWESLPGIPGVCPPASVCAHCGLDSVSAGLHCAKAPRRGPHRNLDNLPAQVAADFAFKLGAAHSFRTDPERVALLAADVEKKHAAALVRFQAKGWIRPDGSEDEGAVKRAIATAYGAQGTCRRCRGGVSCRKCGGSGQFESVRCKDCDGLGYHPGRVYSSKMEPCRGVKVGGRFKGCTFDGLGGHCGVCGDAGQIKKIKGEKLCKNVFDENGVLIEEGCDGTGLDLSTAAFLPRTEKLGVSTERDTKTESGDDDMADYGEDEHNKARTTYLPYLRKGLVAPLDFRPNVLVATGRGSIQNSPLHQMPRNGLERKCIRARGAWCGYPFETILGSTDYEAGELVTLSTLCNWLFKYSQMRETILKSGKPGILHSDLAAGVLGISLDEFLVRLKDESDSGHKQAKDFRQMSKCFHPDTEILTRRRGWVRIADLTMEDEVASAVPHEERPAPVERQRDSRGRFPPASGSQQTRAEWRKNRHAKPSIEIVWTKPTQLTSRRATEGLLHLKNESINLRVTPDHRMLAYGSTKLLRTVEARDFGKQRGWFNAGLCRSGGVVVDERLLRLAVAAQADGSYIVNGETQKRIKFGFSKKRKIDRLKSLLRVGEYSTGVSSNGQNRPSTWFSLSEDLSSQVKSLLDSDKTLPWWWLELSPDLRRVVLEEVVHWDVHKGSFKSFYFSSSVKKNADVLQAIASITDRKATFINNRSSYTRSDGSTGSMSMLSVKQKYDTRGENLEVDRLDYDGEVVCLSVPSSYVLVRDRGVPVVTGQCINFGLPGGMGVPKVISTSRKKNAGFTVCEGGPARNAKGEEGYWGVRFCILTGGAKRCGVEKILEWGKKKYACDPICKACAEVVEHTLKPAYFRRYPEINDYFKWVQQMIDDGRPAPVAVWDEEAQRPRIIRERGGCDFPAFCNNGFQSMLSDIGKHAFVRATKECYLGVKEDGSPSPLAGCRLPIYLHDEPLSELILDTMHLSGPRIAEIMVESGQKFAPGVWRAETAASFWWDKNMEPKYDAQGRLVPWGPIPDYLQHRYQAAA